MYVHKIQDYDIDSFACNVQFAIFAATQKRYKFIK